MVSGAVAAGRIAVMRNPRRIGTLGSRVAPLNMRAAPALPKETDEHYGTPEHKAWALQVKRRASWRCEALDERGNRCSNRHPHSVLYADHIIEIQDDPSLALDPRNGKCLCASHHVSKTLAERARRMGA